MFKKIRSMGPQYWYLFRLLQYIARDEKLHYQAVSIT